MKKGEKELSSNRRVLSVFTLAMINVAAIASLRGLPAMAEYGLSSIFYFVVATLIFLIPTSLISAELATGWPKRGGIYIWVKEAFGGRWGFLAIWLQWIQNVIWYPTVLSFAAATFAFIIDPALANNNIYMVIVILIVYWAATLANFLGMKASGRISTIGVITGTIIPGLFIILLGLIWLALGNPSQTPLTVSAMIPDLSNFSNIVLALGVLLYFAGMEMSAAHAQEVKDPQRNYPKAIFFSSIIILIIFVLGTLAIAIVVPHGAISLVAGIMQALQDFTKAFNLAWLIPIIALFIAMGVFGQISTWIPGPSKGLLVVANDGYLPPTLRKVNRKGVQTNILFVQAIIVSILSLVFLLMPTVSASYWILTILTTQVYLLMYFIMFVSAIKLRYSKPDTPRAYKIPGGKFGMWMVAGIGIVACVFAIFAGYIPPSEIQVGNIFFFEIFLVIGIIIMSVIPLIIHHFSKPSWVRENESDVEE
ncbi:MAG: amino acid permease [archaeon]|nr:amino acid permease [archaeon]